MARVSILNKIFNAGPLILLYYLCISEVDSNLEKIFEIFTLNFQIIIIYYWVLKRPEVMANGHIFFSRVDKRCCYGISTRNKLFIILNNYFCRHLCKK